MGCPWVKEEEEREREKEREKEKQELEQEQREKEKKKRESRENLGNNAGPSLFYYFFALSIIAFSAPANFLHSGERGPSNPLVSLASSP